MENYHPQLETSMALGASYILQAPWTEAADDRQTISQPKNLPRDDGTMAGDVAEERPSRYLHYAPLHHT